MKYLVIGHGAAAVGAIEGIRSADRSGEITVVGDEPGPVFSRPLLAHYLAGEVSLEAMACRPPDFYRRYRVESLLGRRAVELDWQEQGVTLDDGRVLTYDRLLLATGSVTTFPRIPGAALEGVYGFWKLAEAQALARELEGHRDLPAAVVGGGLVGVQAAYGLARAGARVTIIEAMPHLLGRILDATAARLAEELLAQDGIQVLCGRAIKAIEGRNGHATAVILDDGSALPARLVVKATGVAPNLDLVRKAPLKTNRGLLVNSFFQTSLSSVYAAGDVAEAYDVTQGRPAVNANWPNAYRQGWLAGLNMAGKAAPYEGSLAMTSLVIRRVPFISLGLVNPAQEGFQVKTRANPNAYLYRKLVFRDDRLKGAILVGDVEHAGLLQTLIKEQASVGLIKDAILEEKHPFYRFVRARRQMSVEGEKLAWKESHSLPERYEKRFNEASWTEREYDLRPWDGSLPAGTAQPAAQPEGGG